MLQHAIFTKYIIIFLFFLLVYFPGITNGAWRKIYYAEMKHNHLRINNIGSHRRREEIGECRPLFGAKKHICTVSQCQLLGIIR